MTRPAPAGSAERHASGSRGPWSTLRGELSIPTIIIAVIVTVISTLGMNEALRDPFGTSGWAYVALASPALTGGWMAVEQLWRPSRLEPLGQFALRQFAFGLTFGVINALVHVVACRDAAEYGVVHHPDYRYPTAGDQLANGIAAFDLLGYAASIAGGTAVLVLVFLPVTAIRSPRELAEINALSTQESDLAAARATGLFMSVLIVLVFAVPTLIVVGNETDNGLLRWIGILLVPGLVLLTVVVKAVQRPDPSMSRWRRWQWWKH
jgi:hypothetical protein